MRMWEEINSKKSVRPTWTKGQRPEGTWGLLWAVGLRHGGCTGVGELGWSRKKRCDQVLGLCMLC